MAFVEENVEIISDEESPEEAEEGKFPDDFASEAEFIDYVRKTYSDDADADSRNRVAGQEDARFLAGEQWDPRDEAKRKRQRRPTLTINRLPAFVGQIIGNRRLNETQIKVIPDRDGSRPIAELFEGIVRNIEKQSKADRAYNKALENAVICGIGNFGIELQYVSDDAFEQDIRIVKYDNPWSVVWDRSMTDPTGADADHVFVTEQIPRKVYEQRYPKKNVSSFGQGGAIGAGDDIVWFNGDDVMVALFWRMRERDVGISLLVDGCVSEHAVGELPENVVIDEFGRPITRTARRKYAEAWLVSGTNVLEGPYELPVRRVPVFRVPGWEVNLSDYKARWGIVRLMKDPQRLHNYWRSVVAEKLMLSPRAKWIASDAAVSGREAEYRSAHESQDPLLVWNAEAGAPPTFVPPAQIEAALIQESNSTVQDLRDVSNLHEASLGQQSNEVSGKAIVARQRIGELGTTLYFDNLNDAIIEAGQVIVDLIPYVYSNPRTVRVIGVAGDTDLIRIRDPENPQYFDIGRGKYDVSIVTGPSYATKRIEAQEAMLAMFNAAPQLMATAADLYVKNLDFPGAQELADRLRKTLPPGLVDPKDLSPEEQQQIAQNQAQQQQVDEITKQIQLAMAQAELADKQAQAEKATAEAERARAEAVKARAEAQLAVARANESDAKADKLDAEADMLGEDNGDVE